MPQASERQSSPNLEDSDHKSRAVLSVANAMVSPPLASQKKTNDFTQPQNASWRALFYFMTRKHTTSICVALSAAVLTGFVVPFEAFWLGKIFEGFASGKIDNQELVSKTSRFCLFLTVLGIGSWLMNFVFFLAWMFFGDLQAKSARDRLYSGLLNKNMAWYDQQENGIAGQIPRFQM